MLKWIKRAWNVASHGATAYGLMPPSFVSTYVAPIAWTAVVLIAGFVEGVPLMWSLVGGTLAFAGSVTGLLRFSEWRARQTPANKVAFRRVRIGPSLNEKGSIKAVSLGFEIDNLAQFPVQYEIVSLETSFDGLFPPRKKYPRSQFEIAIDSHAWFDDYEISVPNPPLGRTTKAQLSFEIKYGASGRLRYTLAKQFDVFVALNDQGAIAGVSIHEVG